MNQLLSLQLWYLFKYVELTKVVRQNDQTFVNMLSSVCLSTVDEYTNGKIPNDFRYPFSVIQTAQNKK